MKKKSFIVFLLFTVLSGYAQDDMLDSLEKKLISNKEDTSKVNILNSLSIEYAFSSPEKAVKYCEQAFILSKKNNFIKGLATALKNRGVIYNIQGDYEKAFEYSSTSMKIFEAIGDKQGTALSLINIGIVYQDQSNYTKALDYFFQSFKIGEEIKNKKITAKSLSNIGTIYSRQGKDTEALECLTKTLILQKQIGTKHEISGTLNNIGAVYYKQKNSKKALEYYLLALEIFEETGKKSGIALTLANIGIIYKDQGNYTNAVAYFIKSLVPAKEIKNKYLIKEIYNNLSEAYSELKNYEDAYLYHKLYFQVNDSIFNEYNTKCIAEMQTKYETEKKEKEIVNLQNENTIKELAYAKQKNIRNIFIFCASLLLISSAGLFFLFYSKQKSNRQLAAAYQKLKESETVLKELNAVKNKFFSIISHDLRGPLASTKAALNIFLNNTENFTEEELKIFINSILQSTENVNNLFENLLTWARTETNTIAYKPEEFDLHEVVSNTKKLFEQKATQKQININSGIAENTFVYADNNMITFILRNLIDNAIKFTENGGIINISAEEKNNDVIWVSVSDDGIGINEEKQNMLFNVKTHYSSMGTNNEKGTGLGLILCKEFIRINKGEIGVKSRQGEGTTFYFSVQKAEADE